MILFSFGYPPADGGIARLAAEIATVAWSTGCNIRVVGQEDDPIGLTVPPVPVERLTSARPMRELEALTLRPDWHADAVLSGIWYPEGVIAAARRPRFHAILAHGMELMPPPQVWRQRIWARLQRETLRSADVVIANSRYTGELVRRFAPGAVVEVVPLGVDAERFNPSGREAERLRRAWNGKRVVLSVSRLAGYKAHDTVMLAIAAMPPEARVDLVYAIAGRGPAEQSLRDLAAKLGIADHVAWLGFVDEADLPALYAAADLFALVTRESEVTREVEGFGLVFLEAQACSTPVIGSRTGGIPDAVVEDKGGWLIEADDVEGLSAHLLSLMQHPTRFREQGQRGRARVQHECSWAAYWERVREVLHRHGAGIS